MTKYNIILTNESYSNDFETYLINNNYTYNSWIHLPSIFIVTTNDITNISTLSYIKSIEQSNDISLYFSNESTYTYDISYNWGIDRINQRSPILNKNELYQNTYTGNNVNVFLLDSGVLLNHENIKNNINNNLLYDAFRHKTNPDYGYPDRNLIQNTTKVDDSGTHIASIICGKYTGIAKSVNLIPVRIFDYTKRTSSEYLLNAIDWIIKIHNSLENPSIVNISFNINGKHNIFDYIVNKLISSNIIVTCSSGNNSDDSFYYTPSGTGCTRITNNNEINLTIDYTSKPIVVGSSAKPISNNNYSEIVSSFSNYGDSIDIYAPGENIIGSSFFPIISENSSNFIDTTVYSIKSGSNVSCAYVTGVIALHLSKYPSYTQNDIRLLLNETCTNGIFNTLSLIYDRNDDDYTGYIKNNIANQKIVSPNKMLYIWYVDSILQWDSSNTYNISVNENSTNIIDIIATSFNTNNEPDSILYTIQNNPSWIVVNQSIEKYDTYGNLTLYNTIGHIRITSPSVSENYIVPTFIINANNGIETISIDVNVTIINVPTQPYWISPNRGSLGTITNNDIISISLHVTDSDSSNMTYEVLPNSSALPPGLILYSGNIQGTVGNIPKSISEYEFIIRATASTGLSVDRYFYFNTVTTNLLQYFNTSWLYGLSSSVIESYTVYDLSSYSRGNFVSIYIDVINPDSDTLTYKIEPIGITTDSTTFDGLLPYGLTINSLGYIKGTVNTSDISGNYYFKLIISDGSYSMSQNFFINITSGIGINNVNSNSIVWNTDAGLLGSIYETYISPFYVSAYNKNSNNVYYNLVNGSLPDGISIESNTGYISGMMPFVDKDTTYEFIIRANSGNIYTDRRFSFTIKNLYDSSDIMNINIKLNGTLRNTLKKWQNNQNISDSILFKPNDPNFGRIKEPFIYVVNGLKYTSGQTLLDRMRDYYQKMKLRINSINYAKVNDLSGNYIYDVVYLDIIDPMVLSGGFNNKIEYNVYNKTILKDLSIWNLPKYSYQIFPNSINNIRKDLILTDNRQAWIGPDGAIIEPSTERGIGVSLNEGLPLWMISHQITGKNSSILGFIPSIVLLYTLPNKGSLVVNILKNAGILESLTGLEILVDRFFVYKFRSQATSTFDIGLIYNYTEYANNLNNAPANDTIIFTSGNETTFDGSISATEEMIEFDINKIESGKYYKFPPGDIQKYLK